METILKTPELIDDRAKKFLNYNKDSFDTSHEDLIQTKTIKYKYYEYCSYCSCLALPIQAGLRNLGENYNTTGKTCICKGAMDEVDLIKNLADLDDELKSFTNDMKLKKYELKNKHIENTSSVESILLNIIKEDIQKSANIEDIVEILKDIGLNNDNT